MSEKQRIAQGYRMRAEQLRTIAELEADAKIMNALIAIAKDYDRMAENMEAIDRANKNSG